MSVLIFALSGLGKSTLCLRFPDLTYDTDLAFDDALATAFPAMDLQERHRAWRRLARSEPWQDASTADFQTWASTRRRFVADVVAVLESPKPRLVLTNLTLLPWRYHAYYGIELGRLREHWRCLDRTADNDQTEASNNRLEGYSPLVRLPPGRFLADVPDLQRLLASLDQTK